MNDKEESSLPGLVFVSNTKLPEGFCRLHIDGSNERFGLNPTPWLKMKMNFSNYQAVKIIPKSGLVTKHIQSERWPSFIHSFSYVFINSTRKNKF